MSPPPRHDPTVPRSSLATRLTVVMSLLTLVTCIVEGAVLVQRNLAQVRDYLVDRGHRIAEQLGDDVELGVLSGDEAGLQAIAQHTLKRNDVAWVRILDRNGILLASAGAPIAGPSMAISNTERTVGPVRVGNDYWEFQAAVTTVEVRQQREEMQLYDPAKLPSRSAPNGGRRHIGVAVASVSLLPFYKLRQETLTTAIGVTSVLMLLGIAGATWFARATTRPLQALATASNAIARGELGARVDDESYDEVAALGRSFNEMADSIARSHTALESYSRTLEDKVQARTQHLEEVNRELVEASRLKSEFLATVSHELRTPLNVILGYAEMLSDERIESLTASQRELVAAIDRYSRLQLSLIVNVLDFSRLSSGRVSFHVERFPLATLIEEVAFLARARIKSDDVRLDFVAPPLTVELETDRIKLQEILRNLLDNAVKFTERGTIVISARNDSTREHVIIEVRDTGIGIPPAELQGVFEPFRQVGASSTRSTGGVGLGLSIVKQLVTALGGEISLSSDVGKGTVFTVTLPHCLRNETMRSVA